MKLIDPTGPQREPIFFGRQYGPGHVRPAFWTDRNYEPDGASFFSSDRTALSAAWNPMRLWVPSQKGLVPDPPQRQRENVLFPVRS